ncbi:12470_t:CDS:2, partial [Gigaspora rosea]
MTIIVLLMKESNNQIKVGDTFFLWELAEKQLNKYAKCNGFSLHRKRVEHDADGIIRRRTFECSFSGEAVSCKVIDPTQQRQRPSRKINCPWHINLTMPKKSIEVGVTSICGQHNHLMLQDVELYTSKYRKLTDSIINDIEFYVTKGSMSAKQIYPLLVDKYPDHVLLKKDIYNAIKRFKLPLTNHHGDVQNILNKLLELKNEDEVQTDNTCCTNWFRMYLTLLVAVNSNTKSPLVAQCLSKDETLESYKWFFECMLQVTNNSPPICLFSDADPALISAVTLMMPSIQHFLCIFHILENLKKHLRSKLGKNYEKFYKEFLYIRNSLFENDFHRRWARHNNYLQSLPTNKAPSIVEPVFFEVFDLMKKYLTPHILSVQRQQILGSLLYRSKVVSKNVINIIQ